MPFGSSAKQTSKPKSTTETKQNIFFDMTQGKREFRLLGDEIRFKRLFFAKNPDGTWEPTFGYNDKDTREKKPVITAVYNALDEVWVYGGEWSADPIRAYIDSLDLDDDAKKKLYAPQYFSVNVLDRTYVKFSGDNTPIYPDAKGKYPPGLEDSPRKRLNQVKIFTASAGDPKDSEGNWRGKHLYRFLLQLVEDQTDDAGRRLMPTEFDIRLETTGKGIDTSRSFSLTGNYDPIESFEVGEVFDLENWIKPWPHEAVADLMNGGSYQDILTAYGLTMYPNRIPFGENLF